MSASVGDATAATGFIMTLGSAARSRSRPADERPARHVHPQHLRLSRVLVPCARPPPPSADQRRSAVNVHDSKEPAFIHDSRVASPTIRRDVRVR